MKKRRPSRSSFAFTAKYRASNGVSDTSIILVGTTVMLKQCQQMPIAEESADTLLLSLPQHTLFGTREVPLLEIVLLEDALDLTD